MTHIISQDNGFSFIHIPKNGGSTIRHTYLDFDDCGRKFVFGITEHDDLGKVAQGHLPLWVIARYYPKEFQQIQSTWSCAITRGLIERFRSAMAQRAREFLGAKLDDLEQDRLKQELRRVMEHMKANPNLPQTEFCHFTRQRDFVFLNGQQIVSDLYPLEKIDELLAELARRVGVQATEDHVNTSEAVVEGRLTRAAQSGWRAAKPLLPRRVRKTLRNRLRPLVMSASKALPLITEDAEVVSFVREFYAGDFELHAQAQRLAAAR